MFVLLLLASLQVSPATLACKVTAGDALVAGAEIVVNGRTYMTDANGEVRIPVAPLDGRVLNGGVRVRF